MAKRSSEIPQVEQNRTRLRRAESWLKLSEGSESDDEKFVFLLIAFNAAYGTQLPDPNSKASKTEKEKDRFTKFVEKIIELDRKGAIKKDFYKKFINPIRKLKENEYVFGPFWAWVQGRSKHKIWQSQFKRENQELDDALAKQDVFIVLKAVLERLYVLRNQIIHGGTTFKSGKGRDQIRDGSKIMSVLMPEILKIMQDDFAKNPHSDIWGKLDYPRVGDDDHPDRIPTS